MKITRIELFQIETPRYYGQISGHVLVRVEGSYIYPAEGPGLGVEIDEEKLRALTVATA